MHCFKLVAALVRNTISMKISMNPVSSLPTSQCCQYKAFLFKLRLNLNRGRKAKRHLDQFQMNRLHFIEKYCIGKDTIFLVSLPISCFR